MNIKSMNPASGRMVMEDGSFYNIADALYQATGALAEVSGKMNINAMNPVSGRMVMEDGRVVNIAELIKSFIELGGGSITPEQIQAAVEEYLSKNPVSGDTEKVDHGTSDTTFSLTPNVYHTWGEVESLNLTLSNGKPGISNVYWFSFTSGETATKLTLPATIITDLMVNPNTHYEISIVDNYMVYSDWWITI